MSQGEISLDKSEITTYDVTIEKVLRKRSTSMTLPERDVRRLGDIFGKCGRKVAFELGG